MAGRGARRVCRYGPATSARTIEALFVRDGHHERRHEAGNPLPNDVRVLEDQAELLWVDGESTSQTQSGGVVRNAASGEAVRAWYTGAFLDAAG